MPNTFQQFEHLHHQNTPLYLQNSWDAASAKIAELAGVDAIATSSASLCWSRGYADNRSLPRTLLLSAVEEILRVTSLPVSIDIEDGYSDNPEVVAQLVQQLMDIGVVGINIEDGYKSPSLLCDKIAAIRALPHGKNVYINARTDILLNGIESEQEAIDSVTERLSSYQSSGASGGFIPGLSKIDHVQSIKRQISMPLNLMILDDKMDMKALFNAGIQRFSTGPQPFVSAYSVLFEQTILAANSIGKKSAERTFDYTEFNRLFSH